MRRSLCRLIGLLVITGVLVGSPVQATATKKWGTLAITQGPTTVTLAVEVADMPGPDGLRFRKSLPEDSGMLLVYITRHFGVLGMVDILVPLSVALIDYDLSSQQWEIVEIIDMDVAPNPHHGPFQAYQPSKPFRYALEVNQGFFQRHHLGVGAKVQGAAAASLGVPEEAVVDKRGTLTITQGPATVTLGVEVGDMPGPDGLRFRKSLPEDSGMLLVWDTSDFHFHNLGMMDILIPLSVALIDYDLSRQQWEIVEIVDMDVAPNPSFGPFKLYEAFKPFRYALEVNQGFFQRHHLGVGAKVQGAAGASLGVPEEVGVANKRGTLTITQGATTVPLAVEVADTPQSRDQGLRLRKSLPETAGMLFDFERTDIHSVWNAYVLIPLSVAFIADLSDQLRLHHPELVIVDIRDMNVSRNPGYGPWGSTESAEPCRYALAVNQGFFERHNLTVGAKVLYTPR